MSLALLAVAASFLLNYALTPLIIAVAKRNGWYDEPDHRTVHTVPVPRLGGSGFVFSSIIVAAAVITFFGLDISFRYFFVLGGLLIYHVVGVIDDFITIRAVVKLSGQLAGALFFLAGGLVITSIHIPFSGITFSLGPVGPGVTMLWIVAITNAINLMDGLDGLAGGISAIIFGFLALHLAFNGAYAQAIAVFCILGAVAAFLRYNLPAAKIFMGDGGSLWLGALAAIIPLMGGEVSLFNQNWLIAITLLLIPILDTVGAIWRRIRDSKPIHHPDKSHLHHKLLNMGLTNWQILAVVYSLGIIIGLPVMAFSLAPLVWQVIALILAWAAAVGFFSFVHYANRRQNEGQ